MKCCKPGFLKSPKSRLHPQWQLQIASIVAASWSQIAVRQQFLGFNVSHVSLQKDSDISFLELDANFKEIGAA